MSKTFKKVAVAGGVLLSLFLAYPQFGRFIPDGTDVPGARVARTSTELQSISPRTVSGENGTELSNSAYKVRYSEDLRNPLWVSYGLQASQRSSERMKRPQIPFSPDTRTRAGVRTEDFTRTGYTRGHMAPSFAIGAFHGRDAQLETFLLSNISPQKDKCNSGVWNSIERMEADDFAMRFGDIQVVCGPVFENQPPDRLPAGIAIPTGFYKIILRPDGQTIAFLVPQEPPSPKPEDYLTSVGEIERLAGISFGLGDQETARTRAKIW